ncbi:calcium-activated chloride channel regulator 3A-1-like [Amblyomma americanum]
MRWAVSAAVVLVWLLSTGASLEIDTTDGGYKNVVVSISEAVPYNESLIQDIKALFRSSSEFLHKATNGRVYFKHVILELPKTWPKRESARVVSSASFEQSDVRIDLPGEPYGDRPFTQQLRPCGLPGDFIQLTPTFLAQMANSTGRQSADFPAYMFVHQWAHFRYGVFDEFGSPDDNRYPWTYCQDGKVKLNACSEKITFTVRTASVGKCSVDKHCRLARDCSVRLHRTSTGDPIESSIMFMPYVANVSHFCEKSDGIRRHNPFSPNKQNDLCRQKSTWEVISGNADFQLLPNPDPLKPIDVSFEEVQQRQDLAQRVVLVLDVSGSMNDNNRIKFLLMAATTYVGAIEDNSRRLAVITFSDRATVVRPLRLVNSTTRVHFVDSIERLWARGGTCIGCGLREALKLLTTATETPEGAIIVLMSDGKESRNPRVKNVLPDVLSSKVTVSTIALGATADENLEKLASLTRGKAYAFQDLYGNVALGMEAAFVEATTPPSELTARSLTLVDALEVLDGTLVKTFQVDADVGNETVVYVKSNSLQVVQVEAWLVDPSGQRCQSCQQTASGADITIHIPNRAEVGMWTLHLTSPGTSKLEVSVQVKSRARKGNVTPVQVSCEMRSMLVDRPDTAVVYAKVTKGKKVVLNAAVLAEVYGPNIPHESTLELHDDGRDPDNHADDGTYSGYFTKFTGKGRYVVKAHISHQKTTQLDYAVGGSGCGFDSVLLSEAAAPSATGLNSASEFNLDDFLVVNATGVAASANKTGVEALEPFQRVASGGSFQVTANILENQVPPGDIRDLAAAHVRPGENDTLLVQLTWTWRGAHLTHGNASSVEIRAGKDYVKIQSDFESQIKITKDNMIEGNLDPLPSGALHDVVLSLPNVFATRQDGGLRWEAYLAARSTNYDGLKSNTSNVVQLLHTSSPATTTVASTTEVNTPVVTTVGMSTTKEAAVTEALTTIPPPVSTESATSQATTTVVSTTATIAEALASDTTTAGATTADIITTEEATTRKAANTTPQSGETFTMIITYYVSRATANVGTTTEENSPSEVATSENPAVTSVTFPSTPYLQLISAPPTRSRSLDVFFWLSKWIPIGGAVAIVVAATVAAIFTIVTSKNPNAIRAFVRRPKRREETAA